MQEVGFTQCRVFRDHLLLRRLPHHLQVVDLLDKIREWVGGNKEEKIAQAKAAYERERQFMIV